MNVVNSNRGTFAHSKVRLPKLRAHFSHHRNTDESISKMSATVSSKKFKMLSFAKPGKKFIHKFCIGGPNNPRQSMQLYSHNHDMDFGEPMPRNRDF